MRADEAEVEPWGMEGTEAAEYTFVCKYYAWLLVRVEQRLQNVLVTAGEGTAGGGGGNRR